MQDNTAGTATTTLSSTPAATEERPVNVRRVIALEVLAILTGWGMAACVIAIEQHYRLGGIFRILDRS